MRHRAFTLIEVILAMTILGLVGMIGGKLLVTSMDSWRQDAGRRATERFATAALHSLGEDLQTQINLFSWPLPFTNEWAPSTSAERLSLFAFPIGRDAPVAVVWLLEGPPGEQSLWRLEAGPAETLAALPENAALDKLFIGQDDQEAELSSILQSLDARLFCHRVHSIVIQPTGDGFRLALEVAYPHQSDEERVAGSTIRTYIARTQVTAPAIRR